MNPDHPAAVLPDLAEVVRNQEHGLARPPERVDPLVAFRLEALVADRERLVHEEDVGLDVGGDGKGQPRRHAGRIGPDRRVDELRQLGPGDDAGQSPAHLFPRKPKERSLEQDVLYSRQLAVESQAELQERRDPSGHDDAAPCRIEHARDHLEESGLAGPVAADDSQRLARLDGQIEIAQSFDLVEDHQPLDLADRVLLDRPDPLPRDPVAQGDALEPDRGAVSSRRRTGRHGGKSRPTRREAPRARSRWRGSGTSAPGAHRRRSAGGRSGSGSTSD